MLNPSLSVARIKFFYIKINFKNIIYIKNIKINISEQIKNTIKEVFMFK